jgi:fumarylacetoacetase
MSWIEVPRDSDFPPANLPYGVFESGPGGARIGVAIGESVLDVRAVAEAGLLDGVDARDTFAGKNLNALLAAGPSVWRALRVRLRDLLAVDGDPALRGLNDRRMFVERRAVTMRMPVKVGDYVDFYSSEEHASNLGRIFRPNSEPLLPNWKWMPVGYHGRAGSIVVDGTPIPRPSGQRKPPDAAAPVWGPSTMLDIELEIGFFTGARDIFGVVLVNDWSARDIQAWEYQPLGPFLGKSFATTISPWVVTMEALEPFRVRAPVQDPLPLPYLQMNDDCNYDIELAIELRTSAMREMDLDPVRISRTNARELYWTFAQQLAHARSNGASVRAGDLFASGTISGPDRFNRGSLIELTWRGAEPLVLPNGERRTFLEDGDEITLRGWCERDGERLGFGGCSGRIYPSDYVATGVSSQDR